MKCNNNWAVGSVRNGSEPRRIGEVLSDFFESDLPLAVGYREWKQRQQGKSVEPLMTDGYGKGK
jgi:hypothetical protein